MYAEFRLCKHQSPYLKPLANTSEFQIRQRRVRFFVEPIMQTTYVSSSFHGPDKTEKEWKLRFFSSSERPVDVEVRFFKDKQPLLKGPQTVDGSLWEIIEDFSGAHGFSESTRSKVSHFLRNSDTLPKSSFAAHSNDTHFASSGPNAAIVFPCSTKATTIENQKQSNHTSGRFERIALLHALALANRYVLDRFVEEQTNAVLLLSQEDASFENLYELRKKIVSFTAAFSFTSPVKNEGHHELSAYWNKVNEAYGIRKRQTEIMEQSSAVYDLLRDNENRQTQLEQENSRKSQEGINKSLQRTQRKIDLITICVAIFGVCVTLFEPPITFERNWTPEDVWASTITLASEYFK